jgi:hypothetical protein
MSSCRGGGESPIPRPQFRPTLLRKIVLVQALGSAFRTLVHLYPTRRIMTISLHVPLIFILVNIAQTTNRTNKKLPNRSLSDLAHAC